MKPESKAPVFLFGCPRSGTTLLQSLLAAHPQIYSFPETKFFLLGFPTYEPRRQKLGIISRRLKPQLNQYFKNEICRPEMLERFPKIPILDLYTRSFIKILDTLRTEQGKSLWLEKTPEHIYHIDYIERFVPGVRMIHILRNGTDVVASLYEVSHKYPQQWYRARDIDQCLEHWRESVEISLSHSHKPNHTLVKYEELLANPRHVLEKLCEFIGLEFDEKMLQDYGIVAKYLSFEGGGRTVSQGIQNANSQKFYQVFNQEQRQYILQKLAEFNLIY